MENFMYFPINLTRNISKSLEFYNPLLDFSPFDWDLNSFIFENYQIFFKRYTGIYLVCSVFLSCKSIAQVCRRARIMNCIVKPNEKTIHTKDNNYNCIFICRKENESEK